MVGERSGVGWPGGVGMRCVPFLRWWAVFVGLLVASAAWAVIGPPVARADRMVVFGDRGVYLREAEQGVAQIRKHWWDAKLGWFDKYQSIPGPQPLATLWDAFPLFEAVDAIAIADPTAANRAAVEDFGIGAEERYWNPDLQPVGGYAWYPGQRGSLTSTFFDDNGWLGVAFLDAYDATGDRRFLRDAMRAFRFIVIVGWATNAGGGVWWDTAHHHKTAEPLAAAALIGAEIYEKTHIRWYLLETNKLIAWADLHSWNSARGLYARSDVSDTVMNYVEGMMIGAQVTLCRATGDQSHCTRAEQLAEAAMVAFPPEYHWVPETDAIYLRWMLDLYANDHDLRWYTLADQNAQQALANAKDDAGLFTKRWDGGYASAGRLLTVSATINLFAWIVAAPAPGS